MDKDHADLDLYDLLNVPFDCSEKVISRAYRTQALKCHPDKNPGDDAAVQRFHLLAKAYEVLSDPVKKAVYDDKYKAKLAQKKRFAEMDEKRKKMKEKLDADELLFKKPKVDQDAKRAELERVKQDSTRRMKERQEAMKKRMEALNAIIPDPVGVALSGKESNNSKPSTSNARDCTIKLTWKKKKGDYDEAKLLSLFSGFGSVDHILMTGKKKGGALVMFKDITSTQKVISNKNSEELAPFEIQWAGLGVDPE